jgi:hypothetical protein
MLRMEFKQRFARIDARQHHYPNDIAELEIPNELHRTLRQATFPACLLSVNIVGG